VRNWLLSSFRVIFRPLTGNSWIKHFIAQYYTALYNVFVQVAFSAFGFIYPRANFWVFPSG